MFAILDVIISVIRPFEFIVKLVERFEACAFAEEHPAFEKVGECLVKLISSEDRDRYTEDLVELLKRTLLCFTMVNTVSRCVGFCSAECTHGTKKKIMTNAIIFRPA